MIKLHRIFNRSASRAARGRTARPKLESLEDRVLLYSTLGQWTYSSRITYSFMPDGTNVGGVPSVLFQKLNASFPTATWEQQIEQAAALWESVANVNLALVPDGGQPVGSSGNQQDDPSFGDIRIGAVPLPAGMLAMTFLPPPSNGGTDAGDILINSNVNWQINSNYDLMTVVAHEFGHAQGLGHSTVSPVVMYGAYNGIKQALANDDIAGIQSIYGTRQFDQFNTGGHRNNTFVYATNINTYIDGNAQIAIPSLDITTAGQSEWFFVNVPSATNGTMTVTAQSSNLSSLSPKLVVYTSSLGFVGQAAAVNSMGATISVTSSVQCGQGYYVKVLAAGGPGAIGGYGLLVNFGSQSQSPIPPPNTIVASQPDQGGGSVNNAAGAGQGSGGGGTWSVGSLSGWADVLSVTSDSPGGSSSNSTMQQAGAAVSGAAHFLSNWIAPITQNTTIAFGLLGVSPLSAWGGGVPVGAWPGLAAFQALDDALGQWNSRGDRTDT
jgi:hypothetical protein